MSTDRELLELAAKAAGYNVLPHLNSKNEWVNGRSEFYFVQQNKRWNPLTNDGDRYKLARHLGLSIDFTECTVWKRLSDHSLVQEYWGGDCGDEAHAIVRAATEIGKAKP